MTIRPLSELSGDREGRALLKFTFAICLLAMAGAATSPAFKANPLIADSIGQYGHHFPDALQAATNALRGK